MVSEVSQGKKVPNIELEEDIIWEQLLKEEKVPTIK